MFRSSGTGRATILKLSRRLGIQTFKKLFCVFSQSAPKHRPQLNCGVLIIIGVVG